jgi:hypothetical protein
MLASFRDIWGRDYAQGLRRKEEDIVTDEFRRYSTTNSEIPATGKFDPIAGWSQPDIEETFPTLQR